ncbi:MAG: hypothetical protein Q8K98_03570 [Bacteroidota bacterium]|nr:hypothetical protein [Bacteroidota bacterium]
MTKQELIKKTVDTLNILPEEKVKQIFDFTEFLQKQYEEHILQKGIHKLMDDSITYKFLEEEEDLYTVNDLKEIDKKLIQLFNISSEL